MSAFDLGQHLADILLAPAEPRLSVGMAVGARRWPYAGGDPSTWIPPHRGKLLARNDPLAWTGSVLGESPSQQSIDDHLAQLGRDRPGALTESLPVLWEFNPTHAMWEFAANVLPYEEDVLNWTRAREEARRLT